MYHSAVYGFWLVLPNLSISVDLSEFFSFLESCVSDDCLRSTAAYCCVLSTRTCLESRAKRLGDCKTNYNDEICYEILTLRLTS